MKLFPRNSDFKPTLIRNDDRAEANKLKSTYKFNFDKGEFVKKTAGDVSKVDTLESYIQWCEKCILTKRFKHMAYSDKYGEELHTLIGKNLAIRARELEMERMIREALMVHPLTKAVVDFAFRWTENYSVVDIVYISETFLDEYVELNSRIGVI